MYLKIPRIVDKGGGRSKTKLKICSGLLFIFFSPVGSSIHPEGAILGPTF